MQLENFTAAFAYLFEQELVELRAVQAAWPPGHPDLAARIARVHERWLRAREPLVRAMYDVYALLPPEPVKFKVAAGTTVGKAD